MIVSVYFILIMSLTLIIGLQKLHGLTLVISKHVVKYLMLQVLASILLVQRSKTRMYITSIRASMKFAGHTYMLWEWTLFVSRGATVLYD